MQGIKAGYQLVEKAKQLTEANYSTVDHPPAARNESASSPSRETRSNNATSSGPPSLPPTLRARVPVKKRRVHDPRRLHQQQQEEKQKAA